MQKVIAVDVETGGLRPDKGDRIFAVSMTDYAGKDYYWRFTVDPFTRGVIYDHQLEEIRAILSDPNTLYVFYNSLFDLAHFKAIGVNVAGPIGDTMLLADCADNSRDSYALKPLSAQLLGFANLDEEELHKATAKARREGKKLGYKLAEDLKADFWLAPPEVCKKYAVMDTQRTMALYKYYEKILSLSQEELSISPFKHYKDIVRLEHSLIQPVLDINTKGVCLNMDTLDELEAYYGSIVAECQAKITELGYESLNPKSAKQKGELFYDQLDMPEVIRRRKAKDGSTTNTRSTDKKALAGWAIAGNELAGTLIKLSEANQQVQTFIKPFRELSTKEGNERVLRASFNISGAHATGRMSCSEPNLQNITTANSPLKLSDIEARLREAFVPRKGMVWVLADYEQVETVVTAYLSQDPLLKDIIETGKSQHDLTRDRVFGSREDFASKHTTYRKLSKIVNFSLPYGTGVRKLQEAIGCTYDEAKQIWLAYWETYAGVKAYSDKLAKMMKDNGTIVDCFGRSYRTGPDAAYKSLNRIVQGSCAGIFKRATMAVYSLLAAKYPRARIALLIHDEIVIECPPEYLTTDFHKEITQAMQQNFHTLINKPAPMGVSLSIAKDNWGKKEEWLV